MKLSLAVAAISALLIGCSQEISPLPEQTLEERYQAAIIDAMVADDNERSTNLIAIHEENQLLSWREINGQKYVLVSTWTSWDTSYAPEQQATARYDIWVTVVPELRQWWRSMYDGRTDTVLRLEQLLGLSPGRKKTKFLTLWVRTEDLFRPAGDKEINDQTAGPELPQSADSAYRTWFNNSIIYSYYPKSAPWTRLGYTYDWNGQYGERGLSEFVVRKGATCIIHSVQSTADYIK